MIDKFFELLDCAEANEFYAESREQLFNHIRKLEALEKSIKVISCFEPYTQLTELTEWFITDFDRRPQLRMLMRDFFKDLDNVSEVWYNLCKGD